MTRLEPAGEPSMEDILASIRKIIAEDPPGSRALPDVRAEPAAPSVTDRIFQRLGETARSEPAKPADVTEPYLRSAMPSLSGTPVSSPAAGLQKPFDIDAQMAEVLSKTRGMSQRRDVEPSFDPVLPDVQAALDSLPVAPNLGAPPTPQPRAGFTVARDGYVPEAPAKAPINAPLDVPVSDPFEFSLGPSPFAVRSAPAPSIETAMPEVRDTRFQDFGTFVPTRPIIDDAAPVEIQVAANVDGKKNDGPSPIEAGVAEEPIAPAPMAPAIESSEAKPAGVTVNGAPSPEAIAAQLKDFETAINSQASEPVAALESVEKVLAELKSKLDKAAAAEMEAGSEAATLEPVSEPETALAPVAAEMADIETAPAVAIDAVQENEVETEATVAEAVALETAINTPVADIVDIIDPAPIAAPEVVREMERWPARETAQEMVVAEPLRETQPGNSASPFHPMQISAMQNAGMPGARSMENTVAELLRPMLRSWLAENMPKIVERALRKEIDDSLHSEHKTAAE